MDDANMEPRLVDYSLNGRRLTYVNDQVLPSELRMSLLAHRAATGAGSAAGNAQVWAVCTVALLGGLGVAGVLGWAWYGWLAAVMVFAGAAGYARRSGGQAKRPALTTGDRQLIAAATRHLMVPTPDPSVSLSATASEELPVAELIARAIAVRGRIAGSPAWRSEFLALHRTRFEPDREVDEIIQHALQLRCVTEQLDTSPVTGDSPVATAVRRTAANTRGPLAAVWDSLVARLAALTRYSDHLEQLDRELANADVARRALGVDQDVTDLIINTVDNEQAVEHIQAMTEEAEALTAAINDLVETLNGDINTLVAFASPPAG